MSPVLVLILILGLGLILFAVLRFRGTRTIYIRPPQLNHTGGSQQVTTSDAAASHHADPQTGECLAGAAVDGNGRARATASLGHEFQYTGTTPQRFRVSLSFEYRTLVKVTDPSAKATGIVNAILIPNTPNFANDIQAVVGQIENPPGGGFTADVAEFRVLLNPNESFTVEIEVLAIAEAVDAADPGACSADVRAKISQITIAPI